MDTLLKEAYSRATATNHLYNRHRDRWEYLLNGYMGGDAWRQGNYLARYALESDKEYAARLRNTPLDNQVKSVINLYNAYLFRQQPQRDLADLSLDPRITDLLEDADKEGRNFDAFMRNVATWSQLFGHCWVAVSKADIGAANLAQELQQGVRPYLSVFSPLVVTDWTWQRRSDVGYTLSMIRYVEEINDTIQVVKEWQLTEIITTVIDLRRRRATETQTEPNTLGIIPFIQAYAERSPVRGIGVSVVDDIIDQQAAIYNELSEVEQSVRLDSHPSLVTTSDTNIGTGAGSVITVPENLPADLKPYVLDFKGAAIESIYRSIEERRTIIDGMANVGSVRATQIKEMSGVAKELDFQLLNARLSTLADGLELAEEQIWELICQYLGGTWSGSIDYPDSFAIRDTDRELDRLLRVHQAIQDPQARQAIEQELLELVNIDSAISQIGTDGASDLEDSN